MAALLLFDEVMNFKLKRLKSDRYFLAGLAYFTYGVVYLAGAVASLGPARQMSFHGLPWWSFYIGGVLLIFIIPFVIFKKIRWFTLLVALGPASKCFWLFNKQMNSEPTMSNWLFILVAGTCSLLMFRAGFAQPRNKLKPNRVGDIGHG